jgi:anti-sigma B factor antagonist
MASDPTFEIQGQLDVDVGRLTIIGELDIAAVPQVEAAVSSMVARGTRSLSVDLSQLDFADSSGLRLLVVLKDRAIEEGWTLSLIPPPEQALAIFRISGADEALPFIERPR